MQALPLLPQEESVGLPLLAAQAALPLEHHLHLQQALVR